MSNIKSKYPAKTNLLLFNAIGFFIVGVAFFFSDKFAVYLAFIWWFGSISWAIRYRSLSNKGYIKIYEDGLSINYANWKGVEHIKFDDILEIIDKQNSYIIKQKNKKTNKVYLQIIVNEKRASFKEEMKEIKEKIFNNQH